MEGAAHLGALASGDGDGSEDGPDGGVGVLERVRADLLSDGADGLNGFGR